MMLGITDIKTVQTALGHSTATTTLEIYVHAIEDSKRDAANKMEMLIEDAYSQKKRSFYTRKVQFTRDYTG